MTLRKVVATKRLIPQMVKRLVERFDPQQIILFGSQAQGTATAESDVDLLVVLPIKPAAKRRQRLAMQLALFDFGIPTDIVLASMDELEQFRSIPGTIIRPALQHGKVLYVRR